MNKRNQRLVPGYGPCAWLRLCYGIFTVLIFFVCCVIDDISNSVEEEEEEHLFAN